jgi:ribosomal-protein-alanine N-acetyltransferase
MEKEEGIILRKLKIEDLDKIMEFFLDKVILKNLFLDIPIENITKRFEKKWLIEKIKNSKSKKPKDYALAIEINNEFAGVVGITNIDYKNENARIGYWLARTFWGEGYMTKAVKLFLREIDKKFKLRRIEGEILESNIASSRVLEKCGFEHEGIKRKSRKVMQRLADTNIYARVK